MAPDAGEQSARSTYYYDPAVKCCTYVPDLHNFLAGAILSGTNPDAQPGRATVEKRMAEGLGVTPLGLAQPPVYSLLYNRSDHSFGRSRTLRCPHYLEDSGRCGVWLHRDSICSTWFCKHVRGAVGHAFWQESLQRLLSAVENGLARWCVLELHLSADCLRHLVTDASWNSESQEVTGEALDNKVNREAYAHIWGDWRGREGEFFRRCAELVTPLSWADVLAICGQEVRACARLTQDAHRQLISGDVPAALSVGAIQLVQIRQDVTRVASYSYSDPLDVPQIVMELLHHFDGRPVADALAAIAGERGVRLDLDLVRKMVDFGLLVAAAGPR